MKVFVAAVAGAVLLALCLLGSMVTSVPYTTNQQLADYSAVARETGLELPFTALVAVDGVRFHQDYSKVTRATMQQTVELFAMCFIPKPIDIMVSQNPDLEYRTALIARRTLRATFQAVEASGDVTVWIEDGERRIYSNNAILEPGGYTVVTKAAAADVHYRVIVELDPMTHCGPTEVEQVMAQLGLPPDDRKMALNLMATFVPPGESYVLPNPSKAYVWPVEPTWPITSPFGYRLDPVAGGWGFHTGVDIGARQLTDVHTVADGVVIFAGEDGNYGYVVRIDHGRWSTVYAHLEGFYVQTGSAVHQGDRIGLVGNTGKSTGPHLHFEWRVDGAPVDPVAQYR